MEKETYHIFCDDCMGSKGLNTVLPNSVDVIILDPPYNLTNNEWECPINLEELKIQALRILSEKGTIIFFTKQPFTTDVMNIFGKSLFRYNWIWMKEKGTNPFNAEIAPLSQHEEILIFSKSKQTVYHPQKSKGKPYKKLKKASQQGTNYHADSQATVLTDNKGDRFPTSVLYYPRDNNNVGIHPTQKPAGLIEYLLLTYCEKESVVLDAFMGSGVSYLAVYILNSKPKLPYHLTYYGWEINTTYFDALQNRMKTYQNTKKDAYKKPKKLPESQKQLSLFFNP